MASLPIEDRIKSLCERGCRRIFLAALYPHYAAATTATAYDAAFDALKKMRWQPAIRTLPPYHDHPKYISVLGESIRNDLSLLGWMPEVLVASYHGLPQRYLTLGDPYHCHCQKTSRLLSEYLGDGFPKIITTFQSRFGKEPWLQPYTDPKLTELAESGIKRVAVVMPGFSADCVETLEEVAINSKEVFIEAGGENFHAIPCLNDLPIGIDLLETLCRNEIQGWV